MTGAKPRDINQKLKICAGGASVLWRKKIKMKNMKKTKKLFREIAVVLAAVALCVGIIQAGSLTPPAAPAATGYTLADIYNRLNTNATSTEGGHNFSPSGSPAASIYTLTQIYEKIPTIDPAKIVAGTTYLGVAGTYVGASYTWTKAGAGSWEGVNENLDWAANIGPSGWSSQTYSYCGAATCANDGSLQGAASYDGPPGGWNGSNDYTNFNNSALHNYEVITADGTNLVGCTADAGDLVFPDGSAWDKSNAKPYSAKLAGCDSNNASSTEIWAAAGGSGPQYAYARNAPSALAIADAWDGKKNLAAGANGTHSYTNTGKNDDYYDRPAVSWYADTGDGAGTSRLPMIEEYERARQGTSDSAVSLLYGSNSWSYYNWSAEQYPTYSGTARNFYPTYGSASDTYVNYQYYPLWVVVAGQ